MTSSHRLHPSPCPASSNVHPRRVTHAPLTNRSLDCMLKSLWCNRACRLQRQPYGLVRASNTFRSVCSSSPMPMCLSTYVTVQDVLISWSWLMVATFFFRLESWVNGTAKGQCPSLSMKPTSVMPLPGLMWAAAVAEWTNDAWSEKMDGTHNSSFTSHVR